MLQTCVTGLSEERVLDGGPPSGQLGGTAGASGGSGSVDGKVADKVMSMIGFLASGRGRGSLKSSLSSALFCGALGGRGPPMLPDAWGGVGWSCVLRWGPMTLHLSVTRRAHLLQRQVLLQGQSAYDHSPWESTA
jgi:hypothetical protein